MQIPETLIVMRGYPGTGKSTIARALASALHTPLIDRDILRQTCVDILGNLPELGRLSYELMFAAAREQLRLGLSVIIDTPLTYRTTYEQAQHMAHTFHIPLLVVHCHCSEDLQRLRLEGRKGLVSTFQITSWDEWLRWKPLFEQFETDSCLLDTAQPLDDSLSQVVHRIQELHPHKVQ